jgi:hypothetical protein
MKDITTPPDVFRSIAAADEQQRNVEIEKMIGYELNGGKWRSARRKRRQETLGSWYFVVPTSP